MLKLLNIFLPLFYYHSENRLRMFWRVSIQAVLMVLLSLPGGVILTGYYLNTQPSATPALLNREALVTFISNTPSAMLLNTLVTFFAALVSIWLAVRFLDRSKLTEYGLQVNRRWWEEFGIGFALGAGLITIVFFAEWATGLISITETMSAGADGNFTVAIFLTGFNFLLVGFYEELLCRGYQLTNFAQGFQRVLGDRRSIITALVLSSVIFGLLHYGNPDATIISTVNIILVGILLLGVGYVLTGNLSLPIGTHISWNFFQGTVYGFPVSGTGKGAAKFMTITQEGHPLITGGQFGPEAGAVGVGAVLLGALIIVAYVWRRDGEITLHTDIARYSPE